MIVQIFAEHFVHLLHRKIRQRLAGEGEVVAHGEKIGFFLFQGGFEDRADFFQLSAQGGVIVLGLFPRFHVAVQALGQAAELP